MAVDVLTETVIRRARAEVAAYVGNWDHVRDWDVNIKARLDAYDASQPWHADRFLARDGPDDVTGDATCKREGSGVAEDAPRGDRHERVVAAPTARGGATGKESAHYGHSHRQTGHATRRR